ncbi:MAG: DUF1929 domain-containing protein [Bacteroidota bacterium]|nr:DUF1929 domain-containing protein [Bacteroidota bacterium]
MRKIIFICIILIIAINANSQFNIGGVVRDQPFTQFMVNARMTLFNSDTTFFRETRADTSGIFSFSNIPSGNYCVGCSYIGKEYQQNIIVVSGNIFNYNFNLVPETNPGIWNIIVQSPEPLGGTDLAVLQSDGKIFFCHNTRDPFVFDPVTNNYYLVQGDDTIQGCSAPLLMADGNVIFVGGTDQDFYGPGRRKVKTYNPSTQLWQTLPDMIGNRWYSTMTSLTNGKLLILGGGGLQNPLRVKTSELYDISSGTSEAVDSIALGNEVSPIVLLYNGNVLMTHRPPQLYNPNTKQWNTIADFLQGNRLPNGDHSDHELVLMPEGNIIAVGYKSFTPGVLGNFIEKYNPLNNSWSYGANFNPVRSRAKTILLPGKNILVMAGFKEQSNDPTPTNQWGYMKVTDIYNPYTESWRRLASMNYYREYHSLPVLVSDGRVIMVGGEGEPGNEPPFSVIEAFKPPYLFRGVRPEIVNFSQSIFRPGNQITFDVLKTNSVTGVILMSTPSISHFMNCGNNRYIELPFTQSGNNIIANVPSDSFKVLNGYYQLFVMVDDIPSVSKIIKIDLAVKQLQLTALIEGFYDNVSNTMIQDTAKVFLRNIYSPYTIIDSVKGLLNSSGVGTFNFYNAVNVMPYYIVLQHRNSIETWSSGGNSFSAGIMTYSFITASNKAYGSNQIQIDNSPLRYAIYSGDVNQDEIIDVSDAGTIDNDAFNFVTGYIKTDLTGDELVDVSDEAIVDNNVFTFVGVIKP